MPEENANLLRQQLREFMKVNGLSVNAWAGKARISEGTLRNFLNNTSETMTYATLASLAEGARVRIIDLLGERADYGDIVFVEHEIWADRWVSRGPNVRLSGFGLSLPQDPRYPGAARFGVLMADDSFDLHYSEGSVLIIAPYPGMDRQPAAGDRILCVESNGASDDANGRLERLSVRELVIHGEQRWLMLRSTSPRWHAPLEMLSRLKLPADMLHFALEKGSVELRGVVAASYRLE